MYLTALDILPAWWFVTIYWYVGPHQSTRPHSRGATRGSKCALSV